MFVLYIYIHPFFNYPEIQTKAADSQNFTVDILLLLFFAEISAINMYKYFKV
jgi:hypothetical protein